MLGSLGTWNLTTRFDKWVEKCRLPPVLPGLAWPPMLPAGGLLGGGEEYAHLSRTPREQWGAHEWADYARFLEEQGRELVTDLFESEMELAAANRKLSRGRLSVKTTHSAYVMGLFGSVPVRRNPGRKRGSFDERIARQAIELQESGAQQLTNVEACRQVLALQGRNRYRLTKNMLNIMSRLRRLSRN